MTPRIEFCGVPASGKSTLCRLTLRELARRGCSVYGCDRLVATGVRRRNHGVLGNLLGAVLPAWRRRFLGLPHALNDWHRFAVGHPQFTALLHHWLATDQADAKWREVIHYALLESAFHHQLAAEADRPVLLEEGFVQRFYSLRGYRDLGQSDDAVRYAAVLPLPAALIWVDAAPAACLERVQRRAHIPVLLEGEPAERLPARFTEGSALLGALAGELERRGVPVLRVRGDGNAAAEAARIADFAVAAGRLLEGKD